MTMTELERNMERVRALYGENHRITDGNYDRSLAVKCINGTFVEQKKDNVIAFSGIPFVGKLHPEKEAERGILDWDRGYGLTKYYFI